jgi:hypothetical protein
MRPFFKDDGFNFLGYFFRSGPAGEPRRTLIFNNGSDGSVVGAWTDGIACALARGWNAMTFDGPGQNAALVRQGLAFRPDWEKVITPVVDFLCARPDTDGGKLTLLGVSQAGYWEWTLKISPSTRSTLALRMRPYGVVPGTVRQAHRQEGDRRVHRGRGSRLTLRARRIRYTRRTHLRLARRAGPGLTGAQVRPDLNPARDGKTWN